MNSKKSVVAVLKSKSHNILNDYIKLANLAGISGALEKDKPTILKDNISWHLPFPAANTVPWQLEGAIKALQQNGINELYAVHNNTVVTNPYVGGRLLKLKNIYEKYKIEEHFNNDPKDLKWIKFEPRTKMLVLDKIFKNGIQIPEFLLEKT